MPREVRPDEIKVLKAKFLNDDRGRLGLLLFVSKHNGFTGCYARFEDNPKAWEKILWFISKRPPAAFTTLADLGINRSDILHKSDNYVINIWALKWLRRLMLKRITLKGLNRLNAGKKHPYPTKYGERNLNELESGVWYFQSTKKKPGEPIKKRRIIY